ncbi:hypothetical protein AGMMS49525_11140 [Bacteroidia bacterium]|nr:hypothetical protein AGMMS49525_11140 [Bacteroidia bacterium]
MKKDILISALLLAAAFTTGCKDSFLDQEKPLVSTEALVYTNAEKTEMTLLGLYRSFKGTNCDFMGGKTYLAFDNRGDDIENVSTNNAMLYATYLMNTGGGDSENADAWYYAYLTINRANVFLESMEEYNTKSIIGDDTYKQYVAEAKFIRALTYYYLVNLYSTPYVVNPNARAVPLRLTAIKGSGNSDCPSSTIAQVYAAILADLSADNINALPTANGTADYDLVTRASQGAANMLKMRVLMAMDNYTEAITVGEAVKGYDLDSDVRAQFATPYYTTETIFALPQTTNNLPNTQRSPYESYGAAGEVCLIDKATGVMAKSNYSIATDKRVVAFVNDRRLTKWDISSRLQWLPIFRYAETKLNLAECYAKTTQESKAQTALGDVRSRAITSSDPLDVTTLSGADLLEAITNEKRLEFIGEGLRSIEIMRKGENFIKGTEINVAPSAANYTWPIPDKERAANSLWNTLAE